MQYLKLLTAFLFLTICNASVEADPSSDAVQAATQYNQQYQTDLMNRNIANQQFMQQQQAFQGLTGQAPGCYFYNTCREPGSSVDALGLGSLLFGSSDRTLPTMAPEDARTPTKSSPHYKRHRHIHSLLER